MPSSSQDRGPGRWGQPRILEAAGIIQDSHFEVITLPRHFLWESQKRLWPRLPTSDHPGASSSVSPKGPITFVSRASPVSRLVAQ